jgi:hypothetical protein
MDQIESTQRALMARYPELQFMAFNSANPNRGGTGFNDPAAAPWFQRQYGRAWDPRIVNNNVFQQAAGTAGYDPTAILGALRSLAG